MSDKTSEPIGALMCPHCGWQYDPDEQRKRLAKDQPSPCDLVPTHDFPEFCRSVCPGSKQHPRNALTDRRPLWKDEPAEPDPA